MTGYTCRTVQIAYELVVFVSPSIIENPHADEGSVCIENQYEVGWVHPGITFFLERTVGACTGENITLKEGESRCFETRLVQYDSSWQLSALDATTAECRAIGPILSAEITIRCDNSNAYSCMN